jgi:hypothetical protein
MSLLSPPRALLVASLAMGALSCVRLVSLEDRPCGCTEGFVCCLAQNVCVRPEQHSALACDLTDAMLPAPPADSADSAPPNAPESDAAEPLAPDAASVVADAAPVTPDAAPAPDVSRDAAPPPDAAPDREPDLPPDVAPPSPDVAPPSPDAGADGGLDDASGSAQCPAGAGSVLAKYYESWEFKAAPLATRSEPGLVLSWPEAPDPAVKSDFFATVLSAELTADATDTYTFFLESDDGGRLWIDGELLIDWWRYTTPGPLAADKPLVAGTKHAILVEHYDSVGSAGVSVTWKRPATVRGPIPSCLLREAPGEPSRCALPGGECVPPGTVPCGAGNGLTATYYRRDLVTDPKFSKLVHTERNSELYYVWPFLFDAEKVTDRYNVRWDGFLEAPGTGDYTFYFLTDRPTTVFLEGQHGGANNDEGTILEATFTVPLTAGQRYPFRIESLDATPADHPFLQVRWKGPGIPKGAPPRCRFFPPSG